MTPSVYRLVILQGGFLSLLLGQIAAQSASDIVGPKQEKAVSPPVAIPR